MQEVEKAEGEEGEDDFGGVLKRRQHSVDAREPQEDADAGPESTQKLLDDYFGTDDKQLGEEDRFLKKFIANKATLCLCLMCLWIIILQYINLR